jgi:hypothetical protein
MSPRLFSGKHRSGFLPVPDKVVEPENINQAEIDPLQPHTGIAAPLRLGADPHYLSSRQNRAMIIGQMYIDVNPITNTHTFAGADKNANGTNIRGLAFG